MVSSDSEGDDSIHEFIADGNDEETDEESDMNDSDNDAESGNNSSDVSDDSGISTSTEEEDEEEEDSDDDGLAYIFGRPSAGTSSSAFTSSARFNSYGPLPPQKDAFIRFLHVLAGLSCDTDGMFAFRLFGDPQRDSHIDLGMYT